MKLIPKMDSFLFVRLESPFEIFSYEQDDKFLELVRLHLGIPNAHFERHIPCSDGSILLKFNLDYNYIEDIAIIKKNSQISSFSQKTMVV